MSESDGKGSDKVTPKRSSKLVLPPRTARPSDEEFFDRVLRSVETQDESGETQKTHHPDSTETEDAATSPFQVPPTISDEPGLKDKTLEAESHGELNQLPQATEAGVSASSSARVEELRERAVRTSGKRAGAGESLSFQEFERRWTHFLSNTLLNLCKEIHKNTIEKNQDSYDTTARELCEKVGKSKRHTFLLLYQLETMGFVTRKEIREKNRLVGVRIWFHLIPLQK